MNCYLRHWDYEAAKRLGIQTTWIQWMIYLRSKLIHTEYQFSERYGRISFSFTMADGVNGARFKMIGYSTYKLWVTDEIPMTDDEEDAAWLLACKMAGCNPLNGLVYTNMEVYFQDQVIYQGKIHWKYDAVGLLTFANDTPYGGKDNPVFNILRPCLAVPLGFLEDHNILRPAENKAWCSEGGCMLVHRAKNLDTLIDQVRPDKLHPQGLHEYVQSSGLAIKN